MQRIGGKRAAVVLATGWIVLVAAARAPQSPLGRGGEAYLANCAVCHGDVGAGDGPLAPWLHAHNAPHPARLDDAKRLQALGLAGVREIVARGGSHVGRSGTMPSWGPRLGRPLEAEVSAWVMKLPALTPAERGAVNVWLESPAGTPPDARRTYVLYCAGCHGPRGRGDGYFAPALRAKLHPTDLTDRVRFAGVSDDSLRALVSAGGAHAPDAPTMPGWMNALDAATVDAAASAVRELQRSAAGR